MNKEKVLVVGGSSGMGLSLARSLLADGSAVVIAGRSPDRLARARAALADVGDVHTVAADITREDDVIRLFGECGHLDHIVSTAADIEGAYRWRVSRSARRKWSTSLWRAIPITHVVASAWPRKRL